MSCPEIGKEATLINKQIKRSFAIGTKEVTVAEFKRFLDAEGTTNENISAYNLDDNGPMLGVNWFEAAQYCNWLSEQEGLAKCYIQRFDGAMNLEERYLENPGYRLPTGAEWEYACRAGSETKRFFGRSETLLREYGWYLDNSDGQAWPVGQLKPNDLGLFDIYGNAVEWSQDREGIGHLGEQMDDPYLRLRQLRPEDDEQDTMLSVSSDTARVLRGGSFNDPHSTLISGGPLPYMLPGARMVQFGFRVARTLPSGTKQ
jgi:formylglycine-generating enzyme required for sulfatase activity